MAIDDELDNMGSEPRVEKKTYNVCEWGMGSIRGPLFSPVVVVGPYQSKDCALKEAKNLNKQRRENYLSGMSEQEARDEDIFIPVWDYYFVVDEKGTTYRAAVGIVS